MFDGTTVILIALGYVSALFLLAWAGDRMLSVGTGRGRPMIYALSLATYCTSWTFFGSVGLAANTGYDFLPVYLGPILLFTLGLPLLLRIVRLAKGQNSSSVADFLAARYGKSQAVAALVTLVAIVGTLPYLALQLKAISLSMEVILAGDAMMPIEIPRIGFADTSFLITLALIAFTILFGTRDVDATEHQSGLMLAIAAESLVKLVAFIAVGLFIVLTWNGGPAQLYADAKADPAASELFAQPLHGGTWLTVTFLSFCCALLLPRQFHVAIVENNTPSELRRASWLFPLYLVLINLLVVPIAAAGLLTYGSAAEGDMFVMKLPVGSGVEWVSMAAFIGGLSAATAMVIVETVALAIMVSNGVVIPLMLRNRVAERVPHEDMAGLLLAIRRIAIIVVMLCAYVVFWALGDAQILSTIGLISFAAIAQLAPPFFLGLFWRKGNSQGALAGLCVGFAVWAYTLLLPWIVKAGWLPGDILADGPFGLTLLRPEALFYLYFEPLTHGVIWSVGLNVATYVAVSLIRAPAPIERLQAHIFVDDDRRGPTPQPTFRLWRSSITVGDLQETVARYLGRERAERSFTDYCASRGTALNADAEADLQFVRFSEHLLASSIGAASSRLVLSLLLRRENMTGKNAMQLLDDASEALQYNRDLLQSALDQVRHGLSVFDKDMRLICWNRQFRTILGIPPELARVGVPLDRILRVLAERGDFGEGDTEEQVADRLLRLAVTKETYQEHVAGGERILEIRTSPMPQGGIVTTFSDITDRVAAASALARANETLERRVRERTAELLDLNAALEEAKAKADEANLDKTRFLAAASHDVLQPLNAARIYATSLVERPLDAHSAGLAKNVDASLNAVEEIFSALIDISRMDAGRLTVVIEPVSLAEVFDSLAVDFAPQASEKGLALTIVPTTLWVRSDRRLLRRVLQNFVSNAIKYTRKGRIVLGARRKGGEIALQVYDTGPGIPDDKREVIFREFQRLEGAGSTAAGLGLGLSIVERICRILDHPIGLASQAGRGSRFSVMVSRCEAPAVVETPSLAKRVATGTLTGLRVLCIDNEPAVLSGMQSLLSGWECEVATAASTAEALRVVRGSGVPPDIILADYHLDLGTGLDAIKALREEFALALPAIIITADHTPEVERLIRDCDVGLLRKPLKAAALRALVTRKLQSSRSAAAE